MGCLGAARFAPSVLALLAALLKQFSASGINLLGLDSPILFRVTRGTLFGPNF